MSIFRTADFLSKDRFHYLMFEKQRPRMWLLPFLFLPLLTLTACGNSVSSTGVTAPTAQGAAQATMAPIGLPPGNDNRPLKPGANGTVYSADGLPALQPARGINADMLFAEKIKDGDTRFDRLETAVTDLRREFDAVKPAIIRLTAVENDMQELLTQLESLVGQSTAPAPQPLPLGVSGAEAASSATLAPVTAAPAIPDSLPQKESAPVAPAPASAPTPAPADPVPATQAPVSPVAVVPGAASVQGFRIGEHQDKTRLVIDLSQSSSYTRDIDNAEHLLVIELPAARWGIKTTETLKNSPLIQSWTAQNVESGGSRAIVNLKRGVKIVKEDTLKQPDRIVIDFQAE